MSKVKEVFVSISRTINTGNYSSLKLEAGCTLSAEDDESAEAVFEKGWKIATTQIEEQIEEFGLGDK